MNMNEMVVRTIRVRNRHEPGVFGRLATAIGDQDGMLGTITTVALTSQYTIRDLDVLVDDEAHLQRVLDAIAALPDRPGARGARRGPGGPPRRQDPHGEPPAY